MKRVKTYTDAGVVREVKIFNVAGRTEVKAARPPRPRFRDEAERAAHRLAIARRRHQGRVNANFTPASLYGTLTCGSEYELHTFADGRRVMDNFVRRLRGRYRDAKIMMYMGRGKTTHRIHFHILCDGVPEAELRRLWTFGEVVRIDHLREHNYYNGIDHGPDYTGLANYLFDHWTPEQGGRRWKGTRNLDKPKPGRPMEVKREYSETRPPRTPKGYLLVECQKTKYGYFYFKFVRKPAPRGRARRQP